MMTDSKKSATTTGNPSRTFWKRVKANFSLSIPESAAVNRNLLAHSQNMQ